MTTICLASNINGKIHIDSDSISMDIVSNIRLLEIEYIESVSGKVDRMAIFLIMTSIIIILQEIFILIIGINDSNIIIIVISIWIVQVL